MPSPSATATMPVRWISSVPVSASQMPPAGSDVLDTGCVTGCAAGADVASSPTTRLPAGAAPLEQGGVSRAARPLS